MDGIVAYSCTSLDFGAESIGVPLKDSFHCGLAGAFILHVVAAVHTVAAITIAPTCKALTVPAHAMRAVMLYWCAGLMVMV